MKFLKIPFAIVKGWIYLIAFTNGVRFIRVSLLGFRGNNVKISPTAFFKFPKKIFVGNNTFINHNCCIWAAPEAKIIIGSDVLFGPNVVVSASNHGTSRLDLIRVQPGLDEDIEIGDDVWIGANSIITAGVKIGRGCVVGAGSVVTKDLPPYSVCAGLPAKVLRFRNNNPGP